MEVGGGGVVATRSTVSGNRASGSGGGIDVALGGVQLTGTTVSGNRAGSSGGGVFVRRRDADRQHDQQ